MSNAETLAYLNAAQLKLADASNTLKTTPKCPECGKMTWNEMFNGAEHWVFQDARSGEDVVVIACEGYWVIDPAALDIERGYWEGIEGVNI